MAGQKTPETMKIYTQVSTTPIEAQKSFNNGRFSGTDINPMWRIKKLTEIFGPSGVGWWTQNVQFERLHSDQTNEDMIMCTLELVYVNPDTGEISKPVFGVGGNSFVSQRKNGPQCSDEAYKMAYTDALSIACKALGFSADIYYQNDRTKYTSDNVSTDVPSGNKEDLAKVIKKVDAQVKKMTKDMDRDAKIEFGKKFIEPVINTMNYNECKDINALNELYNKLVA